MHSHRVIYDLMDAVRGIMEGRLAPVEQVTEIGSAEVRAVFGSGSRKIAGCMVNEGSLKKGCTIEVCLCTCPSAPNLHSSSPAPTQFRCCSRGSLVPLSCSRCLRCFSSELTGMQLQRKPAFDRNDARGL